MERLRQAGVVHIMAIAAVGLVALILGLGLYTFAYARGNAYLSDDPASCVNCHVMRDQYEAWHHSSHARVAVCNDCHTPHDSAAAKWLVKGINGFNHSFAFTFDTYPERIIIRDFNAGVVQGNCIGCHEETTHLLTAGFSTAPSCITCHEGIGHRTRK
jgi:cytochrome c nitrite reductase small subunit